MFLSGILFDGIIYLAHFLYLFLEKGNFVEISHIFLCLLITE